ncbi:putative thiamine-phosphate pyrophosphorylase [Pseudooceanicola batsensis HTCC2597]|uniref:Putative thiamine-phosphate pyrophosphorylase n=1 Tax=Pseudooceanicola batsensis (strain ATCC BAA-863 / DSM 15984 / KCTC 12145 / HTCC2597) TaxID=252305 RepID=A3TXH3_PSEBH|nr:thiamine phosphate synthase [Pseudooceanicola batsensis]EAQ03533.1 putative thiamine-phosphate pyrophosphorylase [Pseudooceanicola batsensis HTCC2597]
MADTEQPQLYLISPPDFDLSGFAETLGRVLDGAEVACVRLALASHDEGEIARAADTLRDVCHQRDVAIVIDNHILLAERHGLDGVHLTDGARSVRKARKQLGPDAIVGSYCGTSRHDGMTAGESGADYVSFGPVGASSLAAGETAEIEIFDWWSQMIELPVVAEGGMTPELIAQLRPVTDFFGIGTEIWAEDDPAAGLAALLSP